MPELMELEGLDSATEVPGTRFLWDSNANFHPIHLVLNAPTPQNYEALRGQGHMPDLTRDQVIPFTRSHDQKGPGQLLRTLIQNIPAEKFQTIQEISTQ